MAVWAEPRPGRKSRSTDALKKSNNDPLVICTVARLFWAERKIEKARQWFERAVRENSDLGDIWAWWLRFERQYGTTVSVQVTRPSGSHGVVPVTDRSLKHVGASGGGD